MKKLSKTDLEAFQQAIMKDYGLKLEDDDLYQAAFNLIKFFEALINLENESKQKHKEVLKSS